MGFYFPSALGVLLFSALTYFFTLFLRRHPAIATLDTETIQLELTPNGGRPGLVAVPWGEFTAGFSAADGVDLSVYVPLRGTRKTAAVPEIRCAPQDGALSCTARVPVLIDGVERRAGLLKPGGVLRYRNLKIRLLGTEIVSERVAVPRDPRLIRNGVRLSAAGLGVAAALAVLGAISACRTTPWTVPAPVSAPGLPDLAHEAPPEFPAPAVGAPDLPEALPTLPRAAPPESAARPPLLSVAPGGTVPDLGVDVLFVHAHPDDESLDYGALMALSAKAGLRTATVLLTDGEGGIFQQDYSGPREDIVAVRVAEAAAALGELGSSLYIRLGFRNHPYNSLKDIRSAEEIIAAWGGEEAVRRLGAIILALRPRILIAPDGPSAAREHFEHEAAGVLAARALDALRSGSAFEPEARLFCVDPRQHEVYADLVAIPRQAVLDQQLRALLAHQTQADASWFGVKMVNSYPFEYYGVEYWRLEKEPAAFFIP